MDYTDDGCSLYRCLSCRQEWEARSFPRNYCPACGVKFEGELVRPKEEPLGIPQHPPRGVFPWDGDPYGYHHDMGIVVEDRLTPEFIPGSLPEHITQWKQKRELNEYDLFREQALSAAPAAMYWLNSYRTDCGRQESDPHVQYRLRIDQGRYRQYLRALGKPKLPV